MLFHKIIFPIFAPHSWNATINIITNLRQVGLFCFATSKQMKQVILKIDDSVYEKFMGMVSLCPQVEVVSVCQTGDQHLTIDVYVASAIREMRLALAFQHPSDYAYLMVAMNESVVKGLPFFYTPKDFLDYMRESNFANLPGRSTIYNTVAKVKGKYPDWTFTDTPKASEALRRKNLVKQFLSAFVRAQSRKLDGSLDEF